VFCVVALVFLVGSPFFMLKYVQMNKGGDRMDADGKSQNLNTRRKERPLKF